MDPVSRSATLRKACQRQTLKLIVPSCKLQENEVFWIQLEGLLSLWHKNGPINLECYVALGLKFLPRTNTQAYYAQLYVAKKMKCCQYNVKDFLHNTLFLSHTNGPSKLECYVTIVWKGLPTTNTLAYYAYFPSCKENEVLWIQLQVLFSSHFIFFVT